MWSLSFIDPKHDSDRKRMKLGMSGVRRHMRLIVLIALVEWLAIGAVFVLVTRTTYARTPISTQVTECNHVIDSPLFTGQTASYVCPAVSGSWVQGTVATKNSSSLAIIFVPRNGTVETVYNSTGRNFNILFPVSSAGTFTFKIKGPTSSRNVATGSVSVSQVLSSNVDIPTKGHPYRTIGAVVLVAAAMASAFVLLDPGRRISRLERTKGATN